MACKLVGSCNKVTGLALKGFAAMPLQQQHLPVKLSAFCNGGRLCIQQESDACSCMQDCDRHPCRTLAAGCVSHSICPVFRASDLTDMH